MMPLLKVVWQQNRQWEADVTTLEEDDTEVVYAANKSQGQLLPPCMSVLLHQRKLTAREASLSK